ncbi:hypothetical protein CANARDRAFT_27656 [[Candida] arabinofermentans NRRL YB-2248]|uniref:FAM86 N-terminal domain-containing protein n=1 Tax=[Candida] arabinofermentans NRRL YB-2248 TaxID=983967 RepID=A0A1E4T3X7_9ASCO|nr:hypothetical protein CANARDRAFT_27656 [[Candida] arabinofermentans NRRL YB-2248]
MNTLLRRLCQRVPITQIELPSAESITDSGQAQLIETLITISESNPHYSKVFLKKFLPHLESQGLEVSDDLYEKLCDWLPSQELQPTDYDTISYSISEEVGNNDNINDMVMKIRESPRLIAGLGTTGLRTWEASLFLSEYILHNLHRKRECSTDQELEISSQLASQFDGKVVMELGCGTGFVGMALHQHYQKMKKMILTDGDSQLFDNILYNMKLNGIDATADNLSITKLWWSESALPASEINTIIAADVTYDASVIPSLAQVLAEAMGQDNVSSGTNYGRVDVAYIAATVRNEETLKVWEEYLDMGTDDGIWTWCVTTSRPMEQSGIQKGAIWYPVGTPEIRIYKIDRNTNN